MNESEMVQRVAAALCCHKGECQMRSLAGTCCKSEHYASARDAIEEMRNHLAETCIWRDDWHTAIDAALSPTGRGGGE